ncbi:hypothetical protein C2W62_10680 [Candidatus Entotheonella serta]|nr:hypothetical protein C2W62_10680 [Candidatus Entotheonella serta]
MPAILVAKTQGINQALNTLYHRRGSVLASNRTDTIQQIRRQIHEKRSERQALIDRIWQQHPEYAALWHPRPLRANEIPLRANEYLLAYEVTDTLTVAWLVHRGKVLKTKAIPVTRAALEDLVHTYRDTLQAVSLVDLERFNAQAGYRLYKLLLNAMLRQVPADRQLVIVPDEVLGQLPFEALVSGPPRGSHLGQGPHGPFPRHVRYVGDTHVISYTPSATTLAVLRRLKPPFIATKPMLIVADPIFDPSDTRLNPDKASSTIASRPLEPRVLNLLRTVESTGNQYLKRLPKTAAMANELSRMFGPDVTVLKGEQATTANLHKHPLSQYRYLVFATHGVFTHASQQRQEPFLVMSQVGNQEPEDGFLTLSDIMNLRLNAQVSALIAFDTGRGRYVHGEGVLGLGRAFQFVGSQSVLASLWSVAESATVQLTEHFFVRLKTGLTPQDALRQARRDIRREGYEHPFYWASFIHISV